MFRCFDKVVGPLCFVVQILQTVTRAYHLGDETTMFGEGGLLVMDTKLKSLDVS